MAAKRRLSAGTGALSMKKTAGVNRAEARRSRIGIHHRTGPGVGRATGAWPRPVWIGEPGACRTADPRIGMLWKFAAAGIEELVAEKRKAKPMWLTVACRHTIPALVFDNLAGGVTV